MIRFTRMVVLMGEIGVLYVVKFAGECLSSSLKSQTPRMFQAEMCNFGCDEGFARFRV